MHAFEVWSIPKVTGLSFEHIFLPSTDRQNCGHARRFRGTWKASTNRQLQGQVTKEWNQSSHWEQTVFLAAMREMAGAGAVDA
jgi:hypothetical protein